MKTGTHLCRYFVVLNRDNNKRDIIVFESNNDVLCSWAVTTPRVILYTFKRF